jgi:hypothetical protein
LTAIVLFGTIDVNRVEVDVEVVENSYRAVQFVANLGEFSIRSKKLY